MSDKERDIIEDDEDDIVEITDEDGNVYYYREEMILNVGDDKFALLVSIDDEEDDHTCDCDCDCDEASAFFAKIITDTDGKEAYVDLTDEEFDAVQRAYDELMDEEY